ncbi:MAG: hypothetical protein IBX48_04785 [Thiomicrospira sp.]|uniref:hypothetical protein n=1 Tax=Thiomicrospira sp. TaxID=935 RepID=UPI0019E64ABB|nr:hypothetical protein [Thiomicrospira sp.]MBE0493638.1 hypothetical protein [Thiomicrospira sp.]
MASRDWEEDLAQLIGDPLAFQVGYRVREFKDQTRHIKLDAQQMLSEYLQYELDLLPSCSQVTAFNQKVEQLDSHITELEARLNKLIQS